MKTPTLLTAYAFVTSLLLQQPAEVNPRLSLQISTESQELRSGQDLKLELLLTNTSESEITMEETNRFCDYKVEVRDVDGKPAPETKLKSRLPCSGGGQVATGRNLLVVLKPKESRKDELTVNEPDELTRPGQYAIRVVRTANGNPSGQAISNELVVKVVQ